MKRFLIPLALVAALLSVGTAQAGNIEDLMIDCDFVRFGIAAVELDTLWFSADSPGQGTAQWTVQANDYFGIATVPNGIQGDGTISYKRSRVKKVLLLSEEPFQYKPWYAGGFTTTEAAAAHRFVLVDTVDISGANGTEMSKFPCRAMITWPDSMILKEGGNDTVRFFLGY